ncbi:hypothetical protein N7468_000286, partial [Penicillium chermesinum]
IPPPLYQQGIGLICACSCIPLASSQRPGPAADDSPTMSKDSIPTGEVIGIVIGALALFSVISFVPILLMCIRRRQDATRRASEVENLTSSMEQVSVERWLEDQNSPRSLNQFSQDICSICLSSLSSSPYLPAPEPAHLHRAPNQSSSSLPPSSTDPKDRNCTIVLSRCHHAFHLPCLTSWFEYRRYNCPICQAVYSPAETAT